MKIVLKMYLAIALRETGISSIFLKVKEKSVSFPEAIASYSTQQKQDLIKMLEEKLTLLQ